MPTTSSTSTSTRQASTMPFAILPCLVPVPTISTVKQVPAFSYYGSVGPSLLAAVTGFLVSHTDAPEKTTSESLDAFLQATYADCVGCDSEKMACWLTIRLCRPTEEFEMPRWHQDGRMFPYDDGREDVVRSKYALTLAGPPTLILRPSAELLATIHRGEKEHFWWQDRPGSATTAADWEHASDSLREWLAKQYEDEERIPIQRGEIIRFSWGRYDSPIHSEPDMVSDRVFISVMYGSESELRAMCDWRGAEYGKCEE